MQEKPTLKEYEDWKLKSFLSCLKSSEIYEVQQKIELYPCTYFWVIVFWLRLSEEGFSEIEMIEQWTLFPVIPFSSDFIHIFQNNFLRKIGQNYLLFHADIYIFYIYI